MAAARKLSRLAVYGEPLPAQPTTWASTQTMPGVRWRRRISHPFRYAGPFTRHTFFLGTRSMSFAIEWSTSGTCFRSRANGNSHRKNC
jgi:hypothetical protein